MFNKTRINFWIDVTLFTLFVTVVLIGLGLWFILPGGQSGTELSLLGLTRRILKEVHAWVGVTILVGAVIHSTMLLSSASPAPIGWTFIGGPAIQSVHRYLAQVSSRLYRAVAFLSPIKLTKRVARQPLPRCSFNHFQCGQRFFSCS